MVTVHIIKRTKDFTKTNIGSKLVFPNGYFSESVFPINVVTIMANKDKIRLTKEYKPSKVIISESIAHPHAIPIIAKNNPP
ncbi:hypothetical protein JCM1393_23680 [Clostridium carnis]